MIDLLSVIPISFLKEMYKIYNTYLGAYNAYVFNMITEEITICGPNAKKIPIDY